MTSRLIVKAPISHRRKNAMIRAVSLIVPCAGSEVKKAGMKIEAIASQSISDKADLPLEISQIPK
jgi:hypothetical protein